MQNQHSHMGTASAWDSLVVHSSIKLMTSILSAGLKGSQVAHPGDTWLSDIHHLNALRIKHSE